VLRGLASADLPIETPPLPMYMVWHRRRQDDPLHRWLRDALEAVAREAMRA
jgi:DNA-binding transcriptional LysR family regulator